MVSDIYVMSSFDEKNLHIISACMNKALMCYNITYALHLRTSAYLMYGSTNYYIEYLLYLLLVKKSFGCLALKQKIWNF